MTDESIALVERWAEALESGKFTQCFGNYRRGECFCALGVLLQIEKCEWQDGYEDVKVPTKADEQGIVELLPDSLRWDIIRWNDVDRRDFRQIAVDLRALIPSPNLPTGGE